MKNYIYKKNIKLNKDDVFKLYDDAKWTAYTNNMLNLMDAIKNSLLVITAWDNDKLIGLVRVVGDGITIIYIQDILVLESYRRKGIASNLMNKILNKYKDVRQKVLLTDEQTVNKMFYEKLGFRVCDKYELVAFVKIDLVR